jgi:hypothetical protein
MQAKGSEPQLLSPSSEEITLLRRHFGALNEITPFSQDVVLASKIAAYGIVREVGTANDELARFIFDATSGNCVPRESLQARLVQWKGLRGVQIFSTQSRRLELRTQGFYDVVHPTLSRNDDGTLWCLYIFPEIISQIAASHGVELVLVKSWGLNSMFGGFDPKVGFYQTNYWELENNDALKFADLVRQGKLAFLGTHDLIAHIAGVNRRHWPLLKENAHRVYTGIAKYLGTSSKPSISSLILPYTVGVVLDDLAQPPSYGSESHRAVLDELLLRIERNEIPANLPTVLTEFPESFQKVINLSRAEGLVQNSPEIRWAVNALVQDILGKSLVTSGKA